MVLTSPQCPPYPAPAISIAVVLQAGAFHLDLGTHAEAVQGFHGHHTLRTVFHIHRHTVDGLGTDLALHFATGEGTADGAEHRHGSLTLAVTKLVAEQTAGCCAAQRADHTGIAFLADIFDAGDHTAIAASGRRR